MGRVTRMLGSVAKSLQFKATAMVVAVGLTLTVATTGYLVYHSSRLVRQQQHDYAGQAAFLIARAAAPLLRHDDREGLRNLVGETMPGGGAGPISAPFLAYLVVLDARGRVLADGRAQGSHLPMARSVDRSLLQPADQEPRLVPSDGETPDHFDVVQAVWAGATGRPDPDAAGGTPLGFVRVGLIADRWQRSMADRIEVLVGLAVITALVAIPLGFWVVRRILAPLESLGETMAEFARGNLNARSHTRRHDEIGQLTRSFNQMADRHERTHNELLRMNAELEGRVAERTRRLRELASRDPLTGLFNRRHFNDVLHRTFAEAMRYDHDLVCLMLDLDNLKPINDTYGHHAGDEILLLAARTIARALRSSDLAARYGGDEFVALLPKTHAEQAAVLAERISRSFVEAGADRFSHISLGLSVGIASRLTCENATNGQALVRAADAALYESKAAVRGRRPESTDAAMAVG